MLYKSLFYRQGNVYKIPFALYDYSRNRQLLECDHPKFTIKKNKKNKKSSSDKKLKKNYIAILR